MSTVGTTIVRDGGREYFVWDANGDGWWWGLDFDAKGHGPFDSFEAAVEDWRKYLSKKRGQNARSASG